MKGNKLGVVVKGPTENSKYRLRQALASFIAVDNARALVTVGELAQFKGVQSTSAKCTQLREFTKVLVWSKEKMY